LAHDASGDALILTNGPQRVISGQNAIQSGAIPLPSTYIKNEVACFAGVRFGYHEISARSHQRFRAVLK
jgi:hypothetical protein